MKADQSLLQTDERGRVLVSKERRQALLEEFERSGMSGAKFARLAGIKYPTFMYWWKQRRERRGCDGALNAAGAVSFIEAFVEGSCQRAASEGLTVEVAGGARLRIESPMQLKLAAELLRMLAEGGRGC